jgi:hypothetical protein
VHPEVSFRELIGRTLSSKSTGTGVVERRLGLFEAGIELPDLPFPVADVLDAAVAAWSAARYATGAALPYPKAIPCASERSGARERNFAARQGKRKPRLPAHTF